MNLIPLGRIELGVKDKEGNITKAIHEPPKGKKEGKKFTTNKEEGERLIALGVARDADADPEEEVEAEVRDQTAEQAKEQAKAEKS